MWPYEEYTLLQNIIILVTPWVLALLSYFLCRPILFRRISERRLKKEEKKDDES